MGESVSSRPEEGGPLRIWEVDRLRELARDLPVRRVPLESLTDLDRVGWHGRPENAGRLTIREVAEHARRMERAELSDPLILSAQGHLLDGFHRMAKAYLLGLTEIDVVQFDEDPPPDRIRDRPGWLDAVHSAALHDVALHDVVFDCAHPASLARFWAATLDGYQMAPYDEAELAKLAAMGVFDVEDDPMVMVEPVAGAGPRLFFQLVPEALSGNRLHLDLKVDLELRAEVVQRLVELGATVVEERYRGPSSWVTMADPEGNVFDVV